MDELYSLWSEVGGQSVCRQQYIHTLDRTLSSVEEQRHQMVGLINFVVFRVIKYSIRHNKVPVP